MFLIVLCVCTATNTLFLGAVTASLLQYQDELRYRCHFTPGGVCQVASLIIEQGFVSGG